MSDEKPDDNKEPKSFVDRVVDGIESAVAAMIAGTFLSAVALMAMPFRMKVAAGGSAILLAGTLAFFRARRPQATRAARWTFGALAALLFLVAFAWGVAGIFITSAEPLYVSLEQVEGVQPSRMHQLVPGIPEGGTLIRVRDPVRTRALPFILPLLEPRLDLDIRPLTASFIDGVRYVSMPLEYAFWGTRRGTSLRGFTSVLQIPTHGVSYSLDLTRDGSSFDTNFNVGVTTGVLVQTSIEREREGAPWHAIPFPTDRPEETLRYAALLDSALSSASVGETETAFQQLEFAHDAAPTPLEQTRSTLLMALLADRHLQGNVLHSQALQLFINAHRIARRHYDGWTKSGDLESPLGEWIEKEIGAGLLPYKSLFPADDPILEKTTRFMLGARTLTGQGDIRAQVEQMEAFLRIGDDPLDPFMYEQRRIGSLGIEEFEREAAALRGADDMQQRLFVDLALRTLLSPLDGKLDRRRADALNALIYSMRAERQEAYLQEVGLGLSMARVYARLLAKDPVELETWHLSHYRQQLARNAIGPKTFATERAIYDEESKGTPVATSAGAPPNRTWWSGEYLDWFIAQTIRVGWSKDTSGYDATPMLFDSATRGRVFLPGAYALLTFDGDSKTPDFEVVRALFLEHVGYSFEEIRACEVELARIEDRPATAEELETPLMQHPKVVELLDMAKRAKRH